MEKGCVAVLGATSTVARALAARYAQEGFGLLLAGRQEDEVERVGQDLALRYDVPVRTLALDPEAPDYPGALVAATRAFAPLQGVIWAIGTMEGQAAESDPALLRRSTWVNFGAAVAAIEAFLPMIAPAGFIVLLSSVAGERGRRGNYIYGAAKAALSTYGAGLRHRLAGTGPCVTVVQLGVVDSQMTWGLSAAVRAADPEDVAKAITHAVRQGRARVHVPALWGLIMLAVRLMPEGLFNRLDI